MTCQSEVRNPVATMTTLEDRAALLAQLRQRHRELVDAYAVGLGPDEPLSPPAALARCATDAA